MPNSFLFSSRFWNWGNRVRVNEDVPTFKFSVYRWICNEETGREVSSDSSRIQYEGEAVGLLQYIGPKTNISSRRGVSSIAAV